MDLVISNRILQLSHTIENELNNSDKKKLLNYMIKLLHISKSQFI